jgi:hypothetical protein
MKLDLNHNILTIEFQAYNIVQVLSFVGGFANAFRFIFQFLASITQRA